MTRVQKLFDRNDLIEFYKAGMSVHDSAKRVGVSYHVAYEIISNSGIKRTKAESAKIGGAKLLGYIHSERRKPIPEHVINAYISGASINECSAMSGVSHGTFAKYIKQDGIARSRTEVAKIIGNKLRGRARQDLRKPVPELIAEMYKSGMTGRQIAVELHICRKAITKFLKERGLYMTATEKLIAVHGRDTIQEWATRASQAAKDGGGRKNPHEWAKTRERLLFLVGEGEAEVLSELRTLGYELRHQTPVGSYNLDITLDELNIAIEIHRGSWHGRTDVRPERLEYLFNHGWRVIFVQISRHGAASDFPAIARKLVSLFETVRRHPSITGQYGVLSRNGEPTARLPDHFDRWARIEGF